MTIERCVSAVGVKADVVSRKLVEDSFRGCFDRSRAGEFRQARLVCKCIQPFKLDPIAGGRDVESFSLCVIGAASDDVTGSQIRVDTIEAHGSAGECSVGGEALQG